MSDRLDVTKKVADFAVVYMLIPCVKTYPVMTFGHADTYKNRIDGENYAMSSQTHEYEWRVLNSIQPYNPVNYKSKFFAVKLDDSQKQVSEKEENWKTGTKQPKRNSRSVITQTEASCLLNKQKDCLVVEIEETGVEAGSEDPAPHHAISDSIETETSGEYEWENDDPEHQKFSYLKVLEVKSEENKSSEQIAAVIEPPLQDKVCPYPFIQMDPPPYLFEESEEIRFGNLSLQYEAPKHKRDDISKGEDQDWANSSGDVPIEDDTLNPFVRNYRKTGAAKGKNYIFQSYQEFLGEKEERVDVQQHRSVGRSVGDSGIQYGRPG